MQATQDALCRLAMIVLHEVQVEAGRLECAFIIAFVEGCYWNALLASMLTKIKVIASERTSPDRFKYISLKKYKFLIMNLFRFAYKITVQFPSYVDHYPNYLHKKIKVIPNSVSNIHLDKGLIDKKEKIILCVARSCFQKNIPCLLRSFSLIKKKNCVLLLQKK